MEATAKGITDVTIDRGMMNGLVERGIGEDHPEVLRIVLEGWVANDRDALLSELDAMPASVRDIALPVVVEDVISEDYDLGIETLEALSVSDPDLAGSLLVAAARGLGTSNPAEALNILTTHEWLGAYQESDALFEDLVWALSDYDPRSAAGHYENLIDSKAKAGSIRHPMQVNPRKLVESWMGVDRAGLDDWAVALPDGLLKDRVHAEYANEVLSDAPRDALRIADRIGNDGLRLSAFMAIIQNSPPDDRVREWFEGSAIVASEKAFLEPVLRSSGF